MLPKVAVDASVAALSVVLNFGRAGMTEVGHARTTVYSHSTRVCQHWHHAGSQVPGLESFRTFSEVLTQRSTTECIAPRVCCA